MPLDLVQTLADVVAIPSVNPMGQPVSGPEYFEHKVTDYLEQLAQQRKLTYFRQKVEPLRDNLVIRVDGDVPLDQGGQLVLLEAHQDTVPVGGMTIDPWKPVVRDGKLYGRGSCDVKGGLVAMLGAVVRLAEERPAQRPTVVLACTMGEEFGHGGILALPKLWLEKHPILPRQPDLAVIAEPSLLNVIVAHKGVVRWKCRTRGRAGHSSQPHLADNAIYKMARVVLALEKYNPAALAELGSHPLCGPPTISVGIINGGVSVNTVPDDVTIDIDRRILPAEKAADARKHVIDFVTKQLGADFAVSHEEPYISGYGMPETVNGALADRLLTAAKSVAPQTQKIGVPFGTDAAETHKFGVPSVVFGPGSIDQAHTCDEWIAVDQLTAASEILFRFLSQGG